MELESRIRAIKFVLESFHGFGNDEEERREYFQQYHTVIPDLKAFSSFSPERLKYFLVTLEKILLDRENILSSRDLKDRFVSKFESCGASEYSGSRSMPFAGLGICGPCQNFDPTDVDVDVLEKPDIVTTEGPRRKLSSYFGSNVPDKLDLIDVKKALSRSVLVYNDLSNVSETNSRGEAGKDRDVQSHHLSRLRSVRVLKLRTSVADYRHALYSLNCLEGPATDVSTPDGVFVDGRGHARGIFEVKQGINTPTDAMRKGIPEAVNVALRQLSIGVNADEIMVPVVGSNGYLMQFGAVIMLKQSFPVFVAISHVLDLTSNYGLDEAARLLYCIATHLTTDLKATAATSPATVKDMVLDPSLYYTKPLSSFFDCTGNLQTSLYHYFKIMSRLHDCHECRNVVLFPICVREFEDNIQCSSIVYPNLYDYKIGLPDSPSQRVSFLRKVNDAMRAVHRAGVVHLDLYLSNIMWRELSGDGVEIRIIDWDSAHFIEEDLSFEVQQRMVARRDFKVCRVAMSNDNVIADWSEQILKKYYDISLIRTIEKFLDLEILRDRRKYELDNACKRVQEMFLDSESERKRKHVQTADDFIPPKKPVSVQQVEEKPDSKGEN